ncbi:MAG: carboxylating nicotinate-nucleotide diphosphorylase [Vampirovibrionales bacterium]|nr:carboxylating nicotinate-nucleotide diphosphorylase [Vampirovibrionales bacterium]
MIYQDIIEQGVIERALLEDLGQGDLTVDHLPLLHQSKSTAYIRSRAEIVVSGLSVAQAVFRAVDAAIVFEPLVKDGQAVSKNQALARVTGVTASLLKAERTALNFMQHLSGIATCTRAFVDKIHGTPAQLVHTRKTTPGLRMLERQAVLDGGGALHRFNLGSAVMLKDNHLTKISIHQAVKTLRQKVGHTVTIEVEADTLSQVELALEAGADIIMLDNMTPEEVRQALAVIGDKAKTEASGNLSLETIRAYAETGVQYLSTSRITLGAPAVDIGLDFEAG